MRWVPRVESDASASENALDDPHIAHPARGVQRRAAVHAGCGRIEPETQHQLGRVEVLVEDRVGQVTVHLASERREERWILGQYGARRLLVRGESGIDESKLCRASGYEQIVDLAMIEPGRDIVRREPKPECPSGIVHRRHRRIPVFVNAG